MPENPNPSVEPETAKAICTIFEGDYHLGLAAFVNSLVRGGYKGTIWAGYRGALPPWLSQLKRVDARGEEYDVAGQIRMVFLPIETETHLANYKPKFMLDLLANQAGNCEYIWYFDPDVFLRCNWAHFDNWQRHGVALCEEIVNYHLSESDPMRYQWIEIGAAMGLGKPRALNRYFNSGMVGVNRADAELLQVWKRILERIATMGIDMKGFMPGDREMPFHSMDQDALNMAAMYTDLPLTTMGPEAMGFVPSGFTMYHAVGHKPWRDSLLLRALAGYPPSSAEKFFFTQVSSPIRAYSPARLAAKRFGCAVAALIGRFYRRR